jgi:MoaA/NifB/PqqE/SkfB family radical SAM enzyme
MTALGWERAADRLHSLGVKTMKILGGEPTLHKGLLPLVRRLHGHGIRTALLSNGIGLLNADGTIASAYDDLAPYLHAVFPSIDGKRSPFVAKNGPGWKVIDWAKARSIPLVGANVSVGALNMGEIHGVIAELAAQGVRVNLSTYNYLREGELPNAFHFRMDVPRSFKWDPDNLEQAAKFGDVLASLVEFKDHIAGGEEYIWKVMKFGASQSWECVDSNQLRLDADGTVMLCLDKSMPNPMHILGEWGWEEYHRRWNAEREEVGKCSCSWSSPMLAEQRVRNGTEDMAERA